MSAYPGWQNDFFDPEDDDDCVIRCRNCSTVIPNKPTGFVKVMDRVLTWERGVDENGFPWSYPKDCTWIDEPYWDCPNCGESHSLDEVSQ